MGTGDRVIAGTLGSPKPPKSVFDLPDKSNVLQIDMPPSTTKRISYGYNSAKGVKRPDMHLQFHGTDSLKRKAYHGSFLELAKKVKKTKKISPKDLKKLQKKMKKKMKRQAALAKKKKAAKKLMAKRIKNINEKSFREAKDEALDIAKKVEKKSGDLIKKIHSNPDQLEVHVKYSNKKENNNLQIPNNKV